MNKGLLVTVICLFLASAQSEGFEYGPPPVPYQVNAVYHLIVIDNSETYKQITIENTFTVDAKTLFFGTINGISISGEIIARTLK